MASAALGTALVLLCLCALGGALFSYRAGKAAHAASQISDALEEARYAVGAEESLERKYRLEPHPEVREWHGRAAADFVAALTQAKALGLDRRAIDDVIARHNAYLQALGRMFAAVDAGNTALVNQIDGAEVDPAFDVIERWTSDAASTYRALALGSLDNLARIQFDVLLAVPVVFVPSTALVAFFWVLLGRFGREANNALVRETEAIHQREKRFRALVQNASDIILVCDAAAIITYQSPTAETVWGYLQDELLMQPLSTLVHPEDRSAVREVWLQCQTTPGMTRRLEVRLHRSNGRWRHIDLIVTNLLHDPSIGGIVATARDISERKAFEEQLAQQAFYDALTGLPNRALLRDRLDRALTRAEHRGGTVDLLFLDLDNFKRINDSFGHQVGDELLVKAAERLRACVRDEDTVAHLSGDEFVILLEQEAEGPIATATAERIVRRFGEPFRLNGQDLFVSVSVGISRGNAGAQRANPMLREADVAMYHAKGTGRGRYAVFESTLETNTRARLEMESELRQALQQGELRLHYQPIVLLETGVLSGVEALMRWQHPRRGLVHPDEFIPIAEQSDIIVALGQWVLQESCRQLAQWRQLYPSQAGMTVSVNLSPRQFQQPDLLDTIKRALGDAGLPPSCLKLEITEGVIMSDIEAAVPILSALKNAGVQIGVDDFGVGYSSLAYLKRLPLDVLKIDRSFVSGIAHQRADAEIVRAIISMAQSLGLSVTAEGIEDEAQFGILREFGCNKGQGYYFSRPLDGPAAGAYLATHAGCLIEAVR